MKQLLFFSVCVILQLAGAAQYNRSNRKDSAKIIDADYIEYKLENNIENTGAVKLPFNKISFYDVRYDTTFVAVNWQSNVNAAFEWTFNKKYTLRNGLAGSLAGYFNYYYTGNFSADDAELVCYIKRFAITLKDTLLDFYKPRGSLNEERVNNVNVEVEGYYKKAGSLFPAFRMDTVYPYRFTTIKRAFPDIIKQVINPLFLKVEKLDTGKIVKRNAYTGEQISDRYQSRFNLPILTADSCKKGIYKNFEEFKNNAPSITQFTVKTDKIRVNASAIKRFDASSLLHSALQRRSTAVFLYDANEELISPANIFGFCDGTTCWIEHGAFYYPLIRVDHAFEFIYVFFYKTERDNTYSIKILFPLNMENGSID